MKITNKKIIEECMVRIDVLQQYISTIDSAVSHLSKLTFGQCPIDTGNLRSKLIEQELDEWRKLFMWALTIDQPTKDRIKAAAYERFLDSRHSVAEWINPNGYMASSWLSAENDEFQEMSRKAFISDA